MKTAREYISELKLNRSNVEHILQYNNVNGSLLIDLEKMLHAYGKEVANKALKDAYERMYNSETAGMTIKQAILSTPIITL